MSEPVREFSDSEIRELVKTIAGPTFKYFMRRVQNNILIDKSMADVSMNSFISVVLIALSSIDANGLKWIEKFYEVKIGKKIDFERLKLSLNRNLNEQLGIEVH